MIVARLRIMLESTAPAHFGVRSRAFAQHVFQKIATVSIGRLFVSSPGVQLRRSLARVRRPSAVPKLRLALIAHVFHPDILPEILACHSLLPEFEHLHVTAPPEAAQRLRCALTEVNNSTVHVLPNRGRDIAPFLSVLESAALDSYDAVLKLHTKRSVHLLDGDVRRKLLFQVLCGERNATLRALAAFEHPSTGMVGWRSCFRSAPGYWMGNKERVREIATRMRSEPPLKLGFFEGSMFWFRPAALAPLRALNLQLRDFEAEAGQTDGTLHHAVERCFTVATWTSGHVVRDLKGRVLNGS